MSKSYFFLGLGVGLILSGSVFMLFSDKPEKKPETEFAHTEQKESLESEEFKKLLKEIEELKESDENIASEELDISSTKNSPDKKIDIVKTEETKKESPEKKENKSESKNITDNAEKAETVVVEKKKEVKTDSEKKETPKKELVKKEEVKPVEVKKVTIKKETPKKVQKKGKITVLEDKEKNTLAYKLSAEKYQIQFRSSKSLNDSERIKDILKDVIDTETVLVGEYYRLFSKESFSEEIARDVAAKIKKVYNLRTIVWFSDYNLIFKEDKDIKNCEDLQKKIAKYIDTTIKFIDNNYVLMTKKSIPKNLGIEVAEYINREMPLDVTVTQHI